jgi:hypothetical protein
VNVFDVPLADLTLRAGTDGATARVHRGVLGLHSRVLLEALTTPASPPEELPLPGKNAADLKLLTAFMYPRRSRDETFSASSIGRFCEHGREYDMGELLVAAEDWLHSQHGALMIPASVIAGDASSVQRASTFLKLMQLAHDFDFSRFFELCITAWTNCQTKSVVLKECAEDVSRLDSAVLVRLLTASCGSQTCARCRSYGYH